MSRLSLVIPFYNEEGNVDRVVSELIDEFEKQGIYYQLILVNNGSTDNTPKLLKKFADQDPDKINIVTVPVNKGYGWGLINGFKIATGEYVGYMPGDAQAPASDVVKIYFELTTKGLDLCKVYRVKRFDGFKRKFISYWYNIIFQLLFSLNLKDINASPRVMKRRVYETINLKSHDNFFDAEMIIKCKKFGFNVEEVPSIFYKREQGKSGVNVFTVLEFIKNLIFMKFGIKSRQE